MDSRKEPRTREEAQKFFGLGKYRTAPSIGAMMKESKYKQLPIERNQKYKSVDALCVVLPDGRVAFMPADGNLAQACTATWRDSLSEIQKYTYDRANVTGGAVIVHMLESDYQKLPPNQIFPWPEAVANDPEGT